MDSQQPAPVKDWARACGKCAHAQEFEDPAAAQNSVYCPVYQTDRSRHFMTCIHNFKKKGT